ncbi:MAG: inhibitor of cysteine peptidase [Natronomonas sp.]|jgi:inhibitor of cysteine peptidase|uniref:beta-propeller domain-containing protein n=1 Tax=Natronomonas sp. TaxID=2184060 RepID=UPI003988FF92
MVRSVPLSTAQVALVAALVLAAGGVGAMMMMDGSPLDDSEKKPDAAVSTFDSESEFRSYLRDADRTHGYARFDARTGGARAERPREVTADAEAPRSTPAPVATETSDGGGSAGGTDRRASDTNVQVQGIDEPDVLKTTSDTLYYSTRAPRVRHHRRSEERDRSGVRLINASDPAAPEVANRLNVSGRLLLVNDTLVVFDGNKLIGYDVSDRADPERTWSQHLTSRVVAARLYAGHVYLVTANDIDRRDPCPVRPMAGVSVPCDEVYHPDEPSPADTTYTVSVMSPDDGELVNTTSFVGAGGDSTVYVSSGSIYVTYPKPADRTEMLLEFLLTNQTDRLDDQAIDRLEEIRSYDLSSRAKRIETRRAIEAWLTRLPEDERREAERGLREDRRAWAAANKRNFERTGIAKFAIRNPTTDSPSVAPNATGSVPGRPLNQFSMDEHEGQFRIATTVGGAFGTDSENDVYVLDASLERTGSVQGMGVTERIYSVRFVGDEAYVVTFRRIDPFHVLDLSDPDNPTLEGELKLPGYSSYLHPLPGDRVLGIGEEDGKVKLVVFNVSDPTDPTIADDRILDTRWSAVARSHRAFLLDQRHGVFFLPTTVAPDREPGIPERDGPRGEGLVFSYEGGLTLETTVQTDSPAKRAAYIGDYLYVFSDSSMTVVDERTWNQTAAVSFRE